MVLLVQERFLWLSLAPLLACMSPGEVAVTVSETGCRFVVLDFGPGIVTEFGSSLNRSYDTGGLSCDLISILLFLLYSPPSSVFIWYDLGVFASLITMPCFQNNFIGTLIRSPFHNFRRCFAC